MVDKILEVVLEVFFFFRIKRKAKRMKGQVDEED